MSQKRNEICIREISRATYSTLIETRLQKGNLYDI